MKTYNDWKGDLNEYLTVGDEVDEEMIDYIINCLPPACMRESCTQLGEPYSHDEEGRALYYTFSKINGIWTYRGFCRRGCNE